MLGEHLGISAHQGGLDRIEDRHRPVVRARIAHTCLALVAVALLAVFDEDLRARFGIPSQVKRRSWRAGVGGSSHRHGTVGQHGRGDHHEGHAPNNLLAVELVSLF